MKIAFFTETFLPKVDGIVTRLTKTVQHLMAAGDEVLIFCPEGAPSSYMGAQVVGVPAVPLPLYPELKLALPRPAVAEALERFQPDLVHVVNPAVLGLGGIWLAKTKGFPLVASYHTHLPKYLEHYGMGMLEPLLWELLKAAHNQASLNLCTSTAMVSELRDKGIQHTALWQRGVDTDLFRPELRSEAMREKLLAGRSDTGKLLLYIGRLSAEKQIERIKPVLDAMPDARLALVGDGPYRPSWSACLPDPQPISWVTWLAKNWPPPTPAGMRLCSLPAPKPWGWSCWKPWPPAVPWWGPTAGASPTS